MVERAGTAITERTTFRECQGCGTVWHDGDHENGEHHYPWCPIQNGRCSEHGCTADDPVPPELHPGRCPHDDGRSTDV